MSDEPPTDDTPPPKTMVADELLSRGTMFVHLDPRCDDVMVPKWYETEPQLVLQVGYDMPVPIPDLIVNEDGLFATLSFNRSPFRCCVPWDAVFALAGDDGRGMVWPESMPQEIQAEVDREAGRRDPVAPTTEPRDSNVVALIDRREELEERRDRDDRPTPSSPPPKGRKSRELPPYLKVIK